MKIKYRMLGNPVLETMDRIDQLVLDLKYENMFLDYLCNKMQDEMLDGIGNVLIELGE